MTSRLLDVDAAAQYLSVTPRFIRRLVAERRVPFVRLGRHLRFDPADLDRFVEAGRVDAVSVRRAPGGARYRT
ncbi:MAG: hypothetical protein AMXMBFR46_15250 [Acidimicrobiia bacterium]